MRLTPYRGANLVYCSLIFFSKGESVVKCTWAFKIKRFLDSTMRKIKAKICGRINTQVSGVEYFDTYEPVVQWLNIRMMIGLSQVLGIIKISYIKPMHLLNLHKIIMRNSKSSYPMYLLT